MHRVGRYGVPTHLHRARYLDWLQLWKNATPSLFCTYFRQVHRHIFCRHSLQHQRTNTKLQTNCCAITFRSDAQIIRKKKVHPTVNFANSTLQFFLCHSPASTHAHPKLKFANFVTSQRFLCHSFASTRAHHELWPVRTTTLHTSRGARHTSSLRAHALGRGFKHKT